MLLGKIEQIDFGARARILPLLAGVPFYVFVAVMSWLEIKRYRESSEVSLEVIWILPFVIMLLGFVISLSTLAKGMRFTERGLYRRTFLPPRLIEWKDVQTAQITRLNQSTIALELRVNRWRWIIIPLLDFRRGALLLAEIRKRLPFEMIVAEEDLALLDKFSD